MEKTTEKRKKVQNIKKIKKNKMNSFICVSTVSGIEYLFTFTSTKSD